MRCCVLLSGWPGRQGAQTLQGHEFAEFPAAATLRHLGRSLLPAGELLSVEARKDVDGKPGQFHGAMLDRTIGYAVSQLGLIYIKCCFADDRLALAIYQQPGRRQEEEPTAVRCHDSRQAEAHEVLLAGVVSRQQE